MRHARLLATLLVWVFVLSLSYGCTSYASKEELQQLEEQRSKVTAMEKELSDLKSNRRQMEQDLAKKQRQSEEANKEKELVLQRLGEIEKARKAADEAAMDAEEGS